jgi:hypothetical protein
VDKQGEIERVDKQGEIERVDKQGEIETPKKKKRIFGFSLGIASSSSSSARR